MGFMQLLTNLTSMRRKLHIVSIKDRFNANDIHFCFNIISGTLFWALELQTLTCNVKHLNAPKRGLIALAVNIQSKHEEVNLSSDIPCFLVSQEKIEKLTPSQLKFSLKSRRIN